MEGSSSLPHNLIGLSSPNVTLSRIGSISYNSSISAYEIASVDNFKDLAVYVNGSGTYTTGGEETTAHNCSGMTFKLTQSIEGITTPIGYRASDSDKKTFSGTFLGGGNTIKAQLYWPNSYEGLAPFSYIDNATIKELTVTGGITSASDKHYTGGLVGFASGTNLIEGCIVTARIGLVCNATIDNHGGGIVGNGLNSTTTIRNCVFAGEIWGSNSSDIVACGIWGWSDSGTPIIENCLEAGAPYNQYHCKNPMGMQGNNGTVTNSYYLNPKDGNQYNSCPDAKRGRVISAGEMVTVANCGTVIADYSDRGLVIYSTGIKWNGKLYAGPDDVVPLTLNYDTKPFCNFDKYVVSGGTLSGTANPYTLTMPDADVTVSPTWTPYAFPPDGSGSYIINNADDWGIFCAHVELGNNFNGKTVKLKDNISITQKVGTVSGSTLVNPFSGTFLGNEHTITANIEDNDNQGTAPFSYINGATIKNLTVAGTISSNQRHLSGLVSFANGTNVIEGCVVTATLNVSTDYAGGIVGHGMNSTTTVEGCVFAGTINVLGDNNPNVGVIWGWSDSGTPILVNCLEAGTYTNISRMHPMGLQKDAGTISRCYYVTPQIGSPSNACTVSGARPVANTYNTIPDWMGALIENYGLVTVYANGIFCNGIYYKIADTFENLADGDTYTRTEEEEVTAATYTKTTDRVGKYHSWLLPFDYTIKATDLDKFTFYKINMIANSPDPSQEASDKMWVFVKKMKASDVLHANMPYVYKPKVAVTDYAFTTENAVLKAKDTGVITKTETTEDIYNFYATYENTTATAQDHFYYVNIDGTISYGTSVTVGPLRWIVRVESKFGENPQTAYAREMVFFDGEEATGIQEVKEAIEVNGVNDDSWYTLDGRRLSQKPTRAGVYINNGIKRVIK